MRAVRTSTASESGQIGPPGPIRTCIGCRERASAAELLRVVVATDSLGSTGARLPTGAAPVLPVVPDPRRRTPGRGAWVHPRTECVELAHRRRAFGRALRVPGPIDPEAVREFVATAAPISAIPQETKSNGHSMKRRQ